MRPYNLTFLKPLKVWVVYQASRATLLSLPGWKKGGIRGFWPGNQRQNIYFWPPGHLPAAQSNNASKIAFTHTLVTITRGIEKAEITFKTNLGSDFANCFNPWLKPHKGKGGGVSLIRFESWIWTISKPGHCNKAQSRFGLFDPHSVSPLACHHHPTLARLVLVLLLGCGGFANNKNHLDKLVWEVIRWHLYCIFLFWTGNH